MARSRRGGGGRATRRAEEEVAERSFAQRSWDQVWPLAVAVAIALGIRAVVIESYYVPSGSMLRTLLIGDHVFVNKFSFGARVPFTEVHLPEVRDPRRGEIAVFALGRRSPHDICPLDRCPGDYPSEGFVKRIAALPGDTVEFREGVFYLNGKPVPREDTGETFEDGDGRVYRVYREDLDGCVHDILDDPGSPGISHPPFVVPEGRYYFLGDNRDNSNDSRFWGRRPGRQIEAGLSTVRRKDLKGPVMVNYWSWNNRESWAAMLNPLTWMRLLWNEMRWGRIGTTYDCWSG